MSPVSKGCDGELAKTENFLRIRARRKLNILNYPDDIPVINDRPDGSI